MKRLFILFFVLNLLGACSSSTRRLASQISEWQDKQILFPENMSFVFGNGNSTVMSYNSKFKILSYIDSIGCLECKLKLSQWEDLVDELRTAFSLEVDLLLFFHTVNPQNVFYLLRRDSFRLPVCIDKEDSLNKLNHFSSNAALQTFLLDENNKVLAIGNPIRNPKVKELYLKIIRGEKIGQGDEGRETGTEVEIDKAVVSLGSFDWQKEQKVAFTLKNVGDKPLVIQDVATSCGCTTVTYSKEPALPGKEIVLEVVYKADHPERFDKTITVYCNAETSPLRLRINGNAE